MVLRVFLIYALRKYSCVLLLLKSRGEWLRSEITWRRGFAGVAGKY